MRGHNSIISAIYWDPIWFSLIMIYHLKKGSVIRREENLFVFVSDGLTMRFDYLIIINLKYS